MGVKRKLWVKVMAAFLSTLMVFQILPMTVFANEKANIDALNTTVDEIEPAPIECELEDERDEYSKTYLLEDGTYASIISAKPIHTENENGTWDEIAEISESDTVSEAQANIQSETTSVNSAEQSDSNKVTNDYTGITAQSIGTYISGLEDDELRIQDYSINTTDKAYSLAYIKLNDLNLPDLGDKCIVTKATLSAYCSKLSGSQNNIITAKMVNDAWPNNNTNEHPVNDKVLDYNAVDTSNENLYEWDITEAACLWSNGTINNNGIALSPYDTNCKISAFVDSIVLYYEIVDELDSDFSFHSVDMGRAGTAYVNDYTNDFYLVRNELSIDGNVMPVGIVRTYNNSNNTNLTSAGSGWHWNYVSTLTKVRKLNMYKWVLDDNSVIYFEATSNSDVWNEQGKTDCEGHCSGYVLNIGETANTITSEDDYTYIFNASSHKLTSIKDKNNKTITLGYTDDLGLTSITDGLDRSFSFGSSTFNSNKYVNKISALDSNGSAIKLDNSSIYLQYSYSAQNQLGNRTLAAVLYRDSKRVDYTYDENGNMTKIKNIDGTSLSISYDDSGKVTSYTKYSSNETTVLESCTINAQEAYQRIFTDNKGNVTRQQYDSSLNVVSEITGDDGIFSEYDENNKLKSLSVTEKHTNLLSNGNFENGNTSWSLSDNASIVEDENRGNKPESYGNHALKITGNYQSNSYATQKYQFADAQANHKDELYTLGAWVKVNGSKAKDNRTVGILVNEYFNDEFEGETIGDNIASITYDNSIPEWQYMMVTFQLNNDAAGFQIALSYNNQLGDVEFDGVTLYKSTQSSVSEDNSTPSTCPCKNCTEPDCPCACESEEICDCIWCKRGTTTVENNYGLTTKETITDAVTSMESTYSYNSDNYYLTESTDENGNTVYYEYDSNTGKLTSIAFGNENNKINYTYNAVGLLKTVSQTVTNIFDNSAVDMTSEYSYDGDTFSSITHNGMQYSFEYDDYGNTTKVSLNNSTLKTTNYVNSGQNIGNIIYANGDAVVYEYDASGSIRKIYSANTDDNGNLQNQTLKYEYSYNNGVLKSIKDYVNSTITQYTDDGYMVSAVSTDDDGNTFTTLIYSCFSNDSAESYNFNVSDTENHKITYTDNQNQYDADYGITTNSSSVILSTDTLDSEGTSSTDTNTYSSKSITDYFGRAVSNDFGEENNQISTTYTYKTNGSYTTNLVESSTTKIGTEEYKYEYEYDNTGRLIKKSLNGEIIAQYSYDEAGQLIEENNNSIDYTTKVSYDKGGNINKLAQVSITDETDSYDYTYSNNNDQLTKVDEDEIVYDENGNVISTGWGDIYNWSDNQLVDVRSGSNKHYTYKYNEDGMLTSRKTYSISTTGKETERDTVTYYWDGNKLLGEKFVSKLPKSISRNKKTYSMSQASLNITVLYDSNGDAVGFNAFGTTKASTKINETYYYIKDVTGQINSIIRASDKANVCNIYYDAWGEIYNYDGIDPIALHASPFLYKDYIYDMNMDLYYCQSRYYCPFMQRFISMDSIYDTYSLTPLANNTYIYCENDPVNNIDPTGNISFSSAKTKIKNIVFKIIVVTTLLHYSKYYDIKIPKSKVVYICDQISTITSVLGLVSSISSGITAVSAIVGIFTGGSTAQITATCGVICAASGIASGYLGLVRSRISLHYNSTHKNIKLRVYKNGTFKVYTY